ncbi:MAG: cupin domain-containing protein [Patescibacteria group bacterium]
MSGFYEDLEQKTLDNQYFREVLFTGPYSQLVVMSLLPNEEIGMEVHHTVDQFIRVEKGTGKAVIDGEEFELKDGSAVVVPAGANHNILNTSPDEPLKLYTVYAPPNHPEGTIHKTKAEADAAEVAEH